MPMFTNGITAGIQQGMAAADAAVSAIHALAVVETISVVAGVVVVQLLPGIRGISEKS